MSANSYKVPAGTDPYGLGKCTCGHLMHNHGFGMCAGGGFGCICRSFSKGYGAEADKRLNETVNLLVELQVRREFNYWERPKGKSIWKRFIAFIKRSDK